MKYLSLIACIALLQGCSDDKTAAATPAETKVPAQYSFATVQKARIASTVKLPAQLAAYEEVSIFPKVNGYVKDVRVDIGAKVKAGQLLMTLEAPELMQAALQAKEKYARSKADFNIDREHYERFLEASRTAGAISPLDLATLKSKMEADSSLANAEKVNWQMQQTMLAYLQVTAPFKGVITERNVHPGALVSAASHDRPMLELKDIDRLRLQVDVPEALAVQLANKDTVSFYVSSLQGKKMTGTISRQASNINARYRSERMEIDVKNPDGKLSPGMYADVLLTAKGAVNAWSVPKSAVVTSTERKYVLRVQQGKAEKVDVTTGNSSPGSIEVFGDLKAGDRVIANATDQMEAGAVVER